jgi:hypothetical protein
VVFARGLLAPSAFRAKDRLVGGTRCTFAFVEEANKVDRYG